MTRATADAFAPLDPFAIRQLERRIGFELPEDYRGFLARLGGGLNFKEEVASEPLRDRPEYLHAADTGIANARFAGSIVATCFGADERLPDRLGFDWALRNYQGRLPDRSLPVATDGAGNLVCLIDARDRTPGVLRVGPRPRMGRARLPRGDRQGDAGGSEVPERVFHRRIVLSIPAAGVRLCR